LICGDVFKDQLLEIVQTIKQPKKSSKRQIGLVAC